VIIKIQQKTITNAVMQRQNKQHMERSSYHQLVQPIPVVVQVPAVCADVSALSLSFAVHISLSPYAAAYEQAPVKYNTHTTTATSSFHFTSLLFQRNLRLGQSPKQTFRIRYVDFLEKRCCRCNTTQLYKNKYTTYNEVQKFTLNFQHKLSSIN